MKSLLLLITIVFALSAQRSFDYDNMKKEQYDAELLNWRNRYTTTDEKLQKVQKEIDETQPMGSAHQKETKEIWEKIYALVGHTPESYQQYLSELNTLRNDVQTFLDQDQATAYKNVKQIDALQKRLDDLKNNDGSVMTAAKASVNEIQNMINQAREKAVKPEIVKKESTKNPSNSNNSNSVVTGGGVYEVVKGDCLWNISKKSEIYNDPFAWTRIYNANKNIIKNPDLIFPNQVFTIPKSNDVGTYLIQRGDNLTSIAEQFGNSFSWTELYELNKSVLTNENSLTPYTVITIPAN
jgi:LysM repeat protein